MDGEQYVAVMVGVGGSAGLNFTLIDYENAGYVVAWKLGGTAPLPYARPRAPGRVDVPPLDASPERVARGQELYAHHCTRCHGLGVRSRGLLPDLRFSSRQVHEQFADIVLSGLRADRGMASFADLLSREDVEAIHAYVVSQALREPGWLSRGAEWLVERGVCVPGAWLAD